ncbi:alcohol dehydrogenase catalytic domain-containing protein [Paenibacillus allorhizosphaerae]|uniref:Ribulose-5-phosphate reductase 1 n=1 Tax=Paenibacillus allorhizosphaerae TaxID=2849866 RepID=A0ABM8VDK4_9BACL|nr:alcohol dehydrogenase catalytic domain-containing protein [Paenibacillus allorhizosphaerae]CAG7627926.1 Ribulose-5-phosphate reductase 1 [Paenibacillus allorhizosphaerae]
MITNNALSTKSRAFRLTKPGEVVETVLEHPIPKDFVVVKPALASICHADMRYYMGNRRPEALARKLPMALIHEGIGHVVDSNNTSLKEGTRVVIVPNIPGYLINGTSPDECCPYCRGVAGANYCTNGRFLSSGFDGLAQDRLVVPVSCAIPVPDDVPDEIAVLSELCSVSHQALSRIQDRLSDGEARVVVFGDGPVGYLSAAMLHHVFGLGADRLHVFGAIPEKLNEFQFATRHLVQDFDFSSIEGFDVAVECTGGKFSESAINQAIDIMNRGGSLILMGVTEERVPINTRDVLEKGITLIGSSRSYSVDYHPVLKAMRDPQCQQTLGRLLPDHYKQIHEVKDFVAAMDEAAAHRDWKKTYLQFHW